MTSIFTSESPQCMTLLHSPVQEGSRECGAEDTGRLLWGFMESRFTHFGEYVPVAPLECCGVCLSPRTRPDSQCADLQYCSGNGVCVLGACQCSAGYSGADCSGSNAGGGSSGGIMTGWSRCASTAAAC